MDQKLTFFCRIGRRWMLAMTIPVVSVAMLAACGGSSSSSPPQSQQPPPTTPELTWGQQNWGEAEWQ